MEEYVYGPLYILVVCKDISIKGTFSHIYKVDFSEAVVLLGAEKIKPEPQSLPLRCVVLACGGRGALREEFSLRKEPAVGRDRIQDRIPDRAMRRAVESRGQWRDGC